MESVNPDNLTVTTVQSPDIEVEDQGFSRARLQRAHARITVRLGDVACEGRDTVSVEGPSE